MPQIQIRGGTNIQARTRRVDNIIFDSASSVEIQYLNFFIPEYENKASKAYEEAFRTGILKESIRSKLIFNHLEISDADNSTSIYYTTGTEASEVNSNGNTFKSVYGNPNPSNYTSTFDEVVPGNFEVIDNSGQSDEGKWTVLDSLTRRTATKPFEHTFSFDDNKAETTNDMFIFSAGAGNVISSGDKIILRVFRSTQTLDDAFSNLGVFHSGLTSTLMDERTYNIDNDTGWNVLSYNLRDLELPFPSKFAPGKCLLWFEIERSPQLIRNPFDFVNDPQPLENLWHRFSHGAVSETGVANYPNIPDETQSWAVDSGLATISYGLNSRSYTGFVSNILVTDYTLETDLVSPAADDDMMAVVIGYVKEDDYEYTISAVRTCAGMLQGETWAIVTNMGQGINFSGQTITNPNVISRVFSNSVSVPNPGGAWSNNPNGSRIRVEKNGNIIKVFTSQMNSTTIDNNTLIEINLNDYEDTKRFITSRFGFASFSQQNSQFKNITFEMVTGSLTDEEVRQGFVVVGGFGLEQATRKLVFDSVRSDGFEFIENISSERYVIESDDSAFLEKFNTYTFELYESVDGKKDNIIELIESYKLGTTILDYNMINMILKPKKLTFEFSPFTGNKAIDIGYTLLQGFEAGGTILENIITSIEKSQNYVIDHSFGNYKIQQDISKKIIEVSLSGIKYEFDYSDYQYKNTFDLVGKELNLSEYSFIADEAMRKIKGTDLSRSEYLTLNEEDLVLNKRKGLYFFKPKDLKNDITKSLYFGKPKDTSIPINYGFDRYSDSALSFKKYIEIAKDLEFDSKPFYEIIKNTIFENKTWQEKIAVFEFDYVKTSFFERSKDIEFVVKPFYTETLDKTYVNKMFIVDLNIYNSHLKFKPFELESKDVSYFIEQFFLKSVATAVNPTNLFKKMYLEEIFRPKFREIEGVIEFYFDSFIGISSNLWDSNKFQTTYYDVWTSHRPEQGGSNAFGHTVSEIKKKSNPNHTFLPEEGLRETKFGGAGRSGRHVTATYKETQVVTDINSDFLFEFSDIDWDMNAQSKFDEEWGFNNENNFFNWIYTVDEASGRLPECLEITETGRITGKLSETDKFLRQYSWEAWTKEQGYTDENGNFISHYDSLDFNYEDFSMISPREFTLKVNGRNITRGTIDVILNANSSEEFGLGETISQTNQAGEITTFVIDRKLGFFTDTVDLGLGSEERTIVRYSIERLSGDIDIVRKVPANNPPTEFSSLSMLQSDLSQLQTDLQFIEGGSTSQDAEVLRERISEVEFRLSSFLNPNYDPNDPNSQQYIEAAGSGIFAIVDDVSEILINNVSNQSGLTLAVQDFKEDNAGAVVKEVTLVFRIFNNYTFDRDLFLHKSSEVDDSEYANRTLWLENSRSLDYYRYDPIKNNKSLDTEMLLNINQLNESIIDDEEFIEKRDYIINAREYTDPDQRLRYEQFINRIVYTDETSGSNKYLVDQILLQSIDIDNFSNGFPLDDGRQRYVYLENIENENGKFTLNCRFDVDEKTFYDNTDNIRIIRGYPVYASCN